MGMVVRRASAASAGSRPSSLRTAGCTPRASVRSSSTAVWSSVVDLGQKRVERLRIAALLRAGQPDREAQSEQRLLGAVVEVALDAATFGVGRAHQPCARLADVVQAGAQIGLEPRVLEREPGRGGDGFEQFRVLAQRGVVDQRGQRLTGVPQHGHALLLAVGQLDG